MNISLIITTYNWKGALELVLLSAFKQSYMPMEIIIADDGSKIDTKVFIDKISQNSPIPIIHLWQEDRGFQAAKARNKAIAEASGDYIVLIDGDIIMHKDFLLDHFKFSKPGCFVQGVRAKLSPQKALEILKNKQHIFKTFEVGIKNKRNSVRQSLLSYLFSGTRRFNKLNMIQTCNMAFFKNDCLRVNGFNEDFIGWGREDSDFAAKLLHSGVKRRDLKFKGIGYHIHHEGNSREMLQRNHQIYLDTLKNKLVWSANGINKYI
jgi:glycosyltransferase involved in cell wall biosynthesis